MVIRITDEPIKELLRLSLAGKIADDFTIFSLVDFKQSILSSSDLKPAFDLARSGQRVLLTDYPHLVDGRAMGIIESPYWHALRGLKNVAIRSMSSLEESVKELNALPTEAIVTDPLAVALAEKMPKGNMALTTVKHSYKYANDGEEQHQRWRAEASGLFGDLPEEELVRLTLETETESFPVLFEGMHFPDFFVDVEGTLLVDGQLNQDVARRIKEEEAAGSPITIWTGGDAISFGQQLWGMKLPWKVVSKYYLRGTTVRLAIDDLPQPEFEKEFGIKVEEYVIA